MDLLLATNRNSTLPRPRGSRRIYAGLEGSVFLYVTQIPRATERMLRYQCNCSLINMYTFSSQGLASYNMKQHT